MLDRENTLEKLRPYFLLGMSITKACETSGVCDDQTILNWMKEDSEISSKIKAWQNYVSAQAREVVANEINENKNVDLAKWWLERKEKAEFSSRQEQTGADGAPLLNDSNELKEIGDKLNSIINGNKNEPDNSGPETSTDL